MRVMTEAVLPSLTTRTKVRSASAETDLSNRPAAPIAGFAFASEHVHVHHVCPFLAKTIEVRRKACSAIVQGALERLDHGGVQPC